MWSLKNNEGNIHYLRPDLPNIVGRNTGDVVLPNDKSVSRKHASICVINSTMTVEDFGSTYGTYLNENIASENKLEANSKIPLKDKDVIKFGILKNEWIVSKVPYVTCTSTMTLQDKNNLGLVLKEMGFSLCDDVGLCTHLTMNVITLTIKVVLALASLKPIVTPEFWLDCLGCFKNNKHMPDPKLYLPVIKESTLNEQTVSCHVNVARKELFSGKTFIFFSRKQKNLYQQIIEMSGGCCYLLSERCLKKSDLCQPNIVLIQYLMNKNSQDSQVQQSHIDGIVEYMNNKNLRVIPETEIGLAVLFCSLEIYCNPVFSFATIMNKVSVDVPIEKNAVMLAPETQDKNDMDLQCLSVRASRRQQVNETIASSLSTIPSGIVSTSLYSTDDVVKSECADRKTRRSSPLSCEEQPRKKFAQNKTAQNSNSSELFQFINDKNNPSEPYSTKSMLTLSTFKSKKAREVVCNSDDLFNFLPNACEDIKSCRAGTSEIFASIKGNTSPNTSKNNLKKKRDDSELDLPDRKRSVKIDSKVSDKKRAPNKLSFDNTPWLSTKTIKKEKTIVDETVTDSSSTSYLESKLRDLDMKPAIVIVNESLLKRDEPERIEQHQPISPPQTNYKKFVKVQPLRPQNEVIPRSKFSVYEGMVRKAIANMDKDSSDEADNADDPFMSFSKPKNKPPNVTNERVRRL